MEALKAQLALKRKALEQESTARPTKYMRKADLEKIRLEKEREEKEEKERIKKEQEEKEAQRKANMRSLTPDTRNKDPKSVSPGPSSHDATTPTPDAQHKDINLSSEEITLRLRSKGQPIRLFGETERERGLRLRAVELIEEKGLEKAHGGNDFRRIMEDVELKGRQLERDAKVKEGKEGEGATGAEGSGPRQLTEKEKRRLEVESAGPLDLSLLKTKEGKEKVYPMIYWAMKKVLREWEQYLEDRPEEIKRTMQGKLAAGTQAQSAEYLKPLFKQLKTRSLPDDMLKNIAEIVHFMQNRKYQSANDAYLRMSIGNAPWPIGVTMVGIHERSAREKISSDQVAHVLNDEISRKYIQSLKRLLTFSQTKYPPEDMSQLMG